MVFINVQVLTKCFKAGQIYTMQGKFLSNLLLLLFLNLLVKPFWILGIDRTVQNTVGAFEYGQYFALLNFSFLFNIILDIGITNFNNRNIAQNHHLLKKHFSGILLLKFLLAALYILITLITALIFDYDRIQMKFLLMLIFNQFLISFILYLRSNVSGLLLFRTDSFLSVLDRLLMIGICGLLLWGNITDQTFRIEWFVYAQTASYIITAVIALIIVIRKSGFTSLHWSWPFIIMILKKSFPFAILIMLMTFYNRIDSVMIERILKGTLGATQAGIYASAYRLLDAVNMIAYLFSVLLLPIFARMIKDMISVQDLVKLAFSLLMILAVPVGFGSYFYADEIMSLLYKAHTEQSADVFRLLMFGFIAISSTYVFGTLLTANGNLKYLNIMAATGMVINLSLNLYLVPRYYAVGAAYASLVTQFVTSVAQLILVQIIFKFRINYLFQVRLLLYTVFIFLSGYASREVSGDWRLNFMLLMLASVVYAMIFKLISLKKFYRMLVLERIK